MQEKRKEISQFGQAAQLGEPVASVDCSWYQRGEKAWRIVRLVRDVVHYRGTQVGSRRVPAC